MKNKTGSIALSLLLVGTIAINTFIPGYIHAAENDPPSASTNSTGNNKNGSQKNNNTTEPDTQPVKENKNDNNQTTAQEKRVIIVNNDKLQKKIEEKCKKNYDGQSHIGSKKYNGDESYSVVLNKDDIFKKDNYLIYYVDENKKKQDTGIEKVKVYGYYADDNGNASADVLVNDKGEYQKNIVITDISLKKDGKWMSIDSFFADDEKISYDITNLKNFCYDVKEDFNAEAPYFLKGKDILTPAKVQLKLNTDVVSHYYGQSFPKITTDNTKDYYFTLLNTDLKDDFMEKFSLCGEGKTVVAQWNDKASEQDKMNYQISVVGQSEKAVEYKVEYWKPSDEELPDVSCTVKHKEDDNTYKCFATLKSKNGLYKFCIDSEIDSEWSDDLELPVDSKEAEVRYYVRNYNKKSEYYQAISPVQIYEVTPDIKADSDIFTINEMVDGSQAALWEIFMYYSGIYYTNKDNVFVKTTLTTDLPIDAELSYTYTDGSQENKVSVPVNASDWKLSDSGKYEQEKLISLKTEQGFTNTYVLLTVHTKHIDYLNNIKIVARTVENESYTQQKLTESVKLVIDKQKPQIMVSYSDDLVYFVEVNESTPVQSIKYSWDDLSYNESKKIWEKTPEGTDTVYADAQDHYKEDIDNYTFSPKDDYTSEKRDKNHDILSYKQLNGIHTLHIKAVDMAGNSEIISFKSSSGYDNMPPYLNNQCLLVSDSESENGYRAVQWSDLYTVDENAYINTPLKLLVQAEDAKDDYSYTSGVDKVEFNKQYMNKNYTYQDNKWYSFDINENKKYDLEVLLVDKSKNEKTEKLYGALSTLYFDNICPNVTEMHLIDENGYIVDDEIHYYNGENGYYNKKLRLIVKANDIGEEASGVRFVTLNYSDSQESNFVTSSTESVKTFKNKDDKIGTEDEWYIFELDCGGMYNLMVTVTDNSGNKSQDCDYSDYFDKLIIENQKPYVSKAVLLKTTGDDQYAVLSENDITKEDLIGYANQDIRVLIIPDDENGSINSGVNNVIYADETLKKLTVKFSKSKETAEDVQGTEEIEETGYVADLSVGQKYELKFTVKDRSGNSNDVSLAELTGFDSLFLENNIPAVSVINPNEKIDRDDMTYYGIAAKQDNINIIMSTDNDKESKESVRSGIASYEVKDIWHNGNDEKTETVLSSEIFSKGETLYEKQVSLPMSYWKEKEGKHQLVVNVKDKSLNNYIYKSKNFFIDFTEPAEGSISADNSEKGVIIDGIQWFDADEVIILSAVFNEANIDNITVDVEGEEKTSWKYTPDNNDYPVNVENSFTNTVNFSLDNSIIKVDSQNTYKITVTATDLSGNNQTKKLTLKRDFNAPQVNKILVDEIGDDPIIKILRRTFGIFYNDYVCLKVYADDKKYNSSYDSGIDKVTLFYEGLKEPIQLTYDEEKGEFYTNIIPLDINQCFEKNLQITAYDKFGKNSFDISEGYSSIEGTYTDEHKGTNLILIERISPSININMPEQDNKAGNTSQKWYSNRSDHVIEFTVQDEDSGIRNIDVVINGKKISEDSDGKTFLTDNMTSVQANRINEIQKYHLKTEYLVQEAKTQPTDGKYVLEVNVTDNSGNTSTKQTVFYRDVVSPKVDSFTLTPPPEDRNNTINFKNYKDFVEVTDYGFYFRAKFNVVVSVSDKTPSSGLNRIRYTLVPVNGEIQSGETDITNGTATFEVYKEFKGQIYVSAFDYTENESVKVNPEAFVIDTEQLHQSEKHITADVLPQTEYSDANGNPLYTGNVSFNVEITDNISGIKNFTYKIIAEFDSVKEKTIHIDYNKSYFEGQDLGDGWSILKVDRNLVTSVGRRYTFEKDNNNISVVWNMTDNANNTSALSYSTFTIDKIAPAITVTFDGNQQYYNTQRKAKITVLERNFDEKLIQKFIKNTLKNKEGNIPQINFRLVGTSNNNYQAEFVFTEGDYTFDIQGTDRGNHKASVNYTNQNSKEFYVDATDPVFQGFGKFATDNLVNSDQKITLTVVEHNFDRNSITVIVNKDNAETSYNDWKSNGDVHTMERSFASDGVYTVSISGKDKAGRDLKSSTSAKLEIDKTAPEIVVEMEGTSDCYNETRRGTVTVTEKNFDASKIIVTCQKNGQTFKIPGLTFRNEGSVHTASFTLDEGDYSFITEGNDNSVKGADIVDNNANVSYRGSELKNFHVDSTNPEFEGFDKEYLSGVRLFKNDQKLSLMVREHNFSKDLITVKVIKDGDDEHAAKRNNWESNGDIHTMTISLPDDQSKNSVYKLIVEGHDKAGRKIVGKNNTALECSFEIDKDSPKPNTDSKTVILSSENAKENTGVITFKDKNLKSINVTVKREVYDMDTTTSSNDNALVRREVNDIPPKEIQATGSELSINPYDYFVRVDANGDISTDEDATLLEGIYTFTISAIDRAGNEDISSVVNKTFVIMNRGYLAFIDDSDKDKMSGYYAYAGRKIKPDSMGDINIVVYAEKDAEFQIRLATITEGETLIYDSKNPDSTASSAEKGEVTEVSSSIQRHKVKVFGNNISDTIIPEGSSNNEFNGTLNIGLVGNTQQQTLISIKMDNAEPDGDFEQNVRNMTIFDGYYGVSEAKINITGISEKLNIKASTIEDMYSGRSIILEDNKDFVYNSDNGIITITLKGEGEHELKVTLKDEAGNDTNLTVTKIYIGSFMGRWWWLFLLGGLVIAGVITAVIVKLVKKKKP